MGASNTNRGTFTQPNGKPLLQRLCDMVVEEFSGGKRPRNSEIQRICSLLRSVPLEELGVKAPAGANTKPDTKALKPNWAPPITYLHIYECEKFSMGIFCLPKHATIPLHNHPGMTVFSRVLYGNMHVRSLDISQRPRGISLPPASGQFARVVGDRVVTADEPPAVLFPNAGGNIHSFTALTDCAVLDVLSPPYSQDEGRDCTYYQESRICRDGGGGAGGEILLLKEYEPPMDFVVLRGTYEGVAVTDPSKDGDKGDAPGFCGPVPAVTADDNSESLQRLSLGSD